jgi:hypothetical protein
MEFQKYCRTLILLAIVFSHSCLADFELDPLKNCPDSDVTFELITGFVFTAPDSIVDTRYLFCKN